MFPPSAGWLAPSCLAESANPARAPAALAVLGKLSAGWCRLMPQQQQQQGREGCGRLPTWQTAGRAAGRKLGLFCAHSLGETKPGGLDERVMQLGRGTLCPAWALGPHWPQTHWVTLGNLLPFSGPVFSFSKQSGLDWTLLSSPKTCIQFSAESSEEGDAGSLWGFRLIPSFLRNLGYGSNSEHSEALYSCYHGQNIFVLRR